MQTIFLFFMFIFIVPSTFCFDWKLKDKTCDLSRYSVNFEIEDSSFALIPFGFCEGYGCNKMSNDWRKIEQRSFLMTKNDSLYTVISEFPIRYHSVLNNKYGGIEGYLRKITGNNGLSCVNENDNTIICLKNMSINCMLYEYKDSIKIIQTKDFLLFEGLAQGQCELCGLPSNIKDEVEEESFKSYIKSK